MVPVSCSKGETAWSGLECLNYVIIIYLFLENKKKKNFFFKLTNIVSTAWSVNCEVPEKKQGNESVRQVFFILLLNFQKYKIQQQVHIYICFYLCRLHRETIHRETRCAFCRLMQSPWNGARHSNEPATLLNERTNQKIQIFNYVVGMKRYISFLKSASHSATLYFQPTLTEKKSLVY